MKLLFILTMLSFSLIGCAPMGAILQGAGNGLSNTRYSQTQEKQSVICNTVSDGNGGGMTVCN